MRTACRVGMYVLRQWSHSTASTLARLSLLLSTAHVVECTPRIGTPWCQVPTAAASTGGAASCRLNAKAAAVPSRMGSAHLPQPQQVHMSTWLMHSSSVLLGCAHMKEHWDMLEHRRSAQLCTWRGAALGGRPQRGGGCGCWVPVARVWLRRRLPVPRRCGGVGGAVCHGVAWGRRPVAVGCG
jgi:hypothetical protein